MKFNPCNPCCSTTGCCPNTPNVLCCKIYHNLCGESYLVGIGNLTYNAIRDGWVNTNIVCNYVNNSANHYANFDIMLKCESNVFYLYYNGFRMTFTSQTIDCDLFQFQFNNNTEMLFPSSVTIVITGSACDNSIQPSFDGCLLDSYCISQQSQSFLSSVCSNASFTFPPLLKTADCQWETRSLCRAGILNKSSGYYYLTVFDGLSLASDYVKFRRPVSGWNSNFNKLDFYSSSGSFASTTTSSDYVILKPVCDTPIKCGVDILPTKLYATISWPACAGPPGGFFFGLDGITIPIYRVTNTHVDTGNIYGTTWVGLHRFFGGFGNTEMSMYFAMRVYGPTDIRARGTVIQKYTTTGFGTGPIEGCSSFRTSFGFIPRCNSSQISPGYNMNIITCSPFYATVTHNMASCSLDGVGSLFNILIGCNLNTPVTFYVTQ